MARPESDTLTDRAVLLFASVGLALAVATAPLGAAAVGFTTV